MADAFSLIIKDVFVISPRAMIVTGRVAGAPVRTSDRVAITGDGKVTYADVAGIEVYRGTLDVAEVYDEADLMPRGLREEDVQIGFVITHASVPTGARRSLSLPS